MFNRRVTFLNQLPDALFREVQAAAGTGHPVQELISRVTVILATGTCLLTIRVLMRQLGGEPAQAQVLASAIAAGDLTTPVTLRGNDTASLMTSLDGMQANLRGLVLQIKDSAAFVALAADEIAQGNVELSSRTEQQAAALQETAASMEQLEVPVFTQPERKAGSVTSG